jgi:hypothetical protein
MATSPPPIRIVVAVLMDWNRSQASKLPRCRSVSA